MDGYFLPEHPLAVQRGGQRRTDFIDDAIAVVVDVVAGLARQRPAHAAGVEQTFVGLPIAVVVDVVAPLGGRGRRLGVAAGGIQVLADHHAGALTGALPHTARLTEAKALVGVPIAVVVLAVADLGRRQDLILAGAKSAKAVAESHAGLADAKSFGALWPLVATASLTGCAVAEGSVVDAAIAVVVAAVAALVLVGGEACIAPLLHAYAGHHPLRTYTELVGGAGGAVEAFVDLAVAVVVAVVAGLGDGWNGVARAAFCSSFAAPYAFSAGTFSDEAGFPEAKALVDLAVAILVAEVAHDLFSERLAGLGVADRVGIPTCTAHHAALTGAEPAAAGALVAQARHFVDGAIAVVVLVIAGLGAGSTRTCVAAGVGESVTDELALALASADTRLTRIAEAIKVLVGAAVAIVVDVVAGLGAGGAGLGRATDSRTMVCIADPLTLGSACSDPDKTTGRTRGEFVHPAVAVVVDVVADLCLRKDLSFASRPIALGADLLTRDAGTYACSAGRAGVADSPLSSRACGTAVDALVGAAIAVVVFAVADLDGEFSTTPTGVEETLVGATIAVVVLVIADFGDALLRPLVCFYAEVWGDLGVSGTRVCLLTTVGFAPGAVVAVVSGIAALATTIEGEVLIVAAIVVIVQAVAELGVARIGFPAVCDGVGSLSIRPSIGGGHIRGHRIGPVVAGESAVSGGAVAPTSTTLPTVGPRWGAFVGRKVLDAATEAAYEDVEENEDGPRYSSTPWGHRNGFGDSPPSWAVVTPMTSAHCFLVFSFYKPQK